MANPIGDLVSQSFYEGHLKNCGRFIPAIYHDAPASLQSVVTWLDTSTLGKAAEHSSDKGSSIYNRSEVDQIIHVLQEIAANTNFVDELSRLVKADEPAIGVICMYSEQNKLLRKKFNEILWQDSFKSLVKIDTVDSYQGKENRIIIVSITRNDRYLSPGFLSSSNRINVALSRAMDRLLIVGAADMWRVKNTTLPLGKIVGFIENGNNKADFKVIEASVHRAGKGMN
jgi:superfamily I DNA and/or RNA helicase